MQLPTMKQASRWQYELIQTAKELGLIKRRVSLAESVILEDETDEERVESNEVVETEIY